MANTPSGARYRVELEGADALIASTRELSAQVRKQANRDFRDAARNMSTKMAAEIRTGKYVKGGAPQAVKVAKTAAYKRDRLPMVRIPATRVGLSGQAGRSKTGRKVKFRNRAAAGRAEDLSIAWASLGGKRGSSNPHFPGAYYWIKNVYDDAEELGAREWLLAVKAIMKDYMIGGLR